MEQTSDIVVVDDEPNVREVLTVTFEAAGYSVASAADGFEAVALVADQRPRLVVTDIHMPRMSGDELAVELERRFGAERPPVIVITSDRQAAGRLRGDPAYRAIVDKPVDPMEILKLIHDILAPG